MNTMWFVVALAACSSGEARDKAPVAAEPGIARVAVIGGMTDTGFFGELVSRFETATKHRVQIVATGPKHVVIDAFKKGGIDLITVHASDAMINLVADGLAVDPEPWVKNDLVIVGPASDPAKIKGVKSAGAALRAIAETKSKLVIHASMGADVVLHDIQEIEKVKLPPESQELFTGEDPHQILAKAKQLGAYTIVGRIPVVSGKLHEDGIEIMVQSDPLLRRPYLVELSPTAPLAARELAAFMTSPETQKWIATYGVGRFDSESIFFPVTLK